MQNNQEQIDRMIAILKDIKKETEKECNMSDKRFNMNSYTHTQAQLKKADERLFTTTVHIRKLKSVFARLYTGSDLDVGIEEREYKTAS